MTEEPPGVPDRPHVDQPGMGPREALPADARESPDQPQEAQVPRRTWVSRLFVDALEHPHKPRQDEAAVGKWASGLFHDSLVGAGELGRRRPARIRVAAMATAIVLCMAVTIGIAVGPRFFRTIAHPGATTATRTGFPVSVATPTPVTTQSPVATPTPAAEPLAGAPPPAAPGPATTQPATTQPVSTQPVSTQQVSTQQVNPPPPPPPPPVTFAVAAIQGPGYPTYFSATGSWSSLSRGGYPNFAGPILWTGSAGAYGTTTDRANWSLGSPTGGQRWDQTRVRVWIADPNAGAWVRYRVNWGTNVTDHQQTFDVPQQEYSGWYQLGVFNIGTATQRMGSIWIEMTYVKAYTGPKADASCWNGICYLMAAAQVEFAWS